VTSRRPRQPLSRLLLLRIAIVLVFLALVGQLWRLQIVQGDTFRLKANANRFREIPETPARGIIYDREGNILARNRPRYQVAVVPEDLPDDEAAQEAILDELLALLRETPPVARAASPGITVTVPISDTADPSAVRPPPTLEQVQEAVRQGGLGSSFRPVLVSENVSRETALIIEEASSTLPGVQILLRPRREYPYGELLAHVLGYTGPIPAESAEAYEERGYLQTDQVGLAGLEVTFEYELRGQAGYRAVVVDVHGREVGAVGEPLEAVPGHNLVLTIDTQLQQIATTALSAALRTANQRSGVVVVLDPRNGAVLALVSLPSYDNNLFAAGISQQAYRDLSEDEDRPLVNHAISGIYPPGSTFKIIPASAGLQEGIITPRTLLGDSEALDGANDGVMWLPNRYFPWDRRQDQPFYCWTHSLGYGHGRINVVTALAQSCDVFFYQLAGGFREFAGLGLETLDNYTLLFGLGQRTGIDLPAENAGLVPDARWKRLTYGQNWVTGDTYNVAIGQGYVLVTPLQMVNATAAVANGGFLFRPQLVQRVTDAQGGVLKEFTPDLIRELPISYENLALVRQGMYEAVNWEHGTATGAAIRGVAVAGKTGSAEYFADRNHDGWPDRDAEGNLPTHAWFTAFAPYEDPEVALVVLVEGGGEGSGVAVPVAAEILQAYFAPPEPADANLSIDEAPPENVVPEDALGADAADGQ
jgi:penicillin-binding protein 2